MRRRRAARRWTATNAGVGLLLLVASLVATVRSGLVDDDIYNLDVVASLGWESLTFPIFFTQFSPGHRVLTMLQSAVGSHNHVVMHAVMSVLLVGIYAVTVGVMSEVHGRRRWVPPLIGLALLGPSSLRISLWYATAFHELPSLLLGMAGVWAWLRHRRGEHTDTWLFVSVASVSVGLLFSIRTILAVIVILVLEGLDEDLQDRGAWWRRWRARSADLAWFVVPMAMMAYLTFRFVDLPQQVDLVATADAVLMAIPVRTLPLLFGVDVMSLPHAWQDPIAWAAAAALAGYVWYAAWERNHYGWVVAGATVVVVVALGLSSLARVPFLGEAAALPLRYQLQPLLYLLVLLPWRGRVRPERHAGPTPHRARGERLAFAGYALVTLALLVFSGRAIHADWTGPESARWFAAVRSAVGDAEAGDGQDGGIGVLATPLPRAVVPTFPGRTLADGDHLVDGLRIAPRPDSMVVTAAGDLEAPRARVVFEQTGAALSTNTLVAVSGDHEIRDQQLCTTSTMSVKVVLAPHPLARMLALDVSAPAAIVVTYTPRDGQPDELAQSTDVTVADSEVWLPLDLSGYTAEAVVSMTAHEGQVACLSSVRFLEIANPLPLDPGAPRNG